MCESVFVCAYRISPNVLILCCTTNLHTNIRVTQDSPDCYDSHDNHDCHDIVAMTNCTYGLNEL